MSNTKYVGRVGALAVALGVGISVANTPAVAYAETADSSKCSSDSSEPDRTALVMGGATVPTPDDYLVEVIKNQYIEPTHPGEDIAYCRVSVRMEAWPITGLVRVLGIAFGDPEVWGPGGAGWWPDAPLWKLTGLFDLTADQAVRAGVSNLEQAMADHPNVPLVIYGISEGSLIATAEKRKLAEQYPEGTDAPDIDFVMQGTFNRPNGGLHARFPGLYLPIDWTFDGPAPTDTQFDTVIVDRQYDGIGDFPLYPINVVADLNALLGTVYVHTHAWDVSLPALNPTESAAYQGKYGDTSYYLFETHDLPLFGPLRTLGVPESLIDVVEPSFRVIVELGYDRSIPPWEPTPARLIPRHDPATVADDLLDAIGEGVTNARALFGSPAPLNIPKSVTADEEAAAEELASGPESSIETVSPNVGEPVSQLLATVGSQPLQPLAVSQHDTIDEGINNAAALSGSPPPLNTPAPPTANQGEAVAQSGAALDTTLNGDSRDVGDDASLVQPAVDSQLPKPPAVTHDDLVGTQRTVSRELAATRNQINDTIGEVNSVIGNGRTNVRAGDRGSTETTARPERKTSVRDAVTRASSDINKFVTSVSDSIKQTLSGGQDYGDGDDNREDETE